MSDNKDQQAEARPSVLFACIHNSGRSVAAQVLAEHHAGGRLIVRSAGSAPKDHVNPQVEAVLLERGLEVTGHIPTVLSAHLVASSDVIVTMGCGESCPVFPGKRYEDWSIDDPAGQDLEVVRDIVNVIDVRVRRLLRELLAEG
jgi:arsenate reductase (thioredoxin)